MLEYHAAYYPMDGGWYMAKVLEYPGVITQGKDLDDARDMLRDALREMAKWDLEDGKALPLPKENATDTEAEILEPICLTVRVQSRVVS